MGRAGPVAIHTRPAEAVDSGFNLANFRRNMGMMHAEDLEVGGEDEDDNLVIHTRQLDDDTDMQSEEVLASLGSDAGYERLAKSKVRGGVDESWARAAPTPPPSSSPAPPLAPTVTPPMPRSEAPTPRPLPQRAIVVDASTVLDAWPYWIAAMSALLAMFVLFFAVLSVLAAITP